MYITVHMHISITVHNITLKWFLPLSLPPLQNSQPVAALPLHTYLTLKCFWSHEEDEDARAKMFKMLTSNR